MTASTSPTDMTADADITTLAGTDNTGAGRAVIDNTAVGATIDTVIANIDIAIDKVNSQRATLGAAQNRFEAVISNLQVSVENQAAAAAASWMPTSRSETANLSRAQILQQAGNAMVAQANQLPQQVLTLLRGAKARRVPQRRLGRRHRAHHGHGLAVVLPVLRPFLGNALAEFDHGFAPTFEGLNPVSNSSASCPRPSTPISIRSTLSAI